MYYPSLEEIQTLADSGQYRRIPICQELYADRYTPVEVMRRLRGASRHCFMLESASQTEVWGRYTFLGYQPIRFEAYWLSTEVRFWKRCRRLPEGWSDIFLTIISSTVSQS